MKTVVLRGGPSGEHEVSLKTGEFFLNNMPDYCDAVDVIIGKDGVWRIQGNEMCAGDILNSTDLAINALHGDYGEDGVVQKELENAGVLFTGSQSIESRIAMNKKQTKDILSRHGVQTPKYLVIQPDENVGLATARVFQTLSVPCVVKPLASGSSLGVSIVDRKILIEAAIEEARKYGTFVLVEEYIQGREASCGVIDAFRGQDVYMLPAVEIRPNSQFYDYTAKYGGGTEKICPGRFSQYEKKEIARTAEIAHKALGLRHYSRTDVIVSPTRGIFMLEVNTLPGLTEESLLPKSLKAVGSSAMEFVEHIINLSSPQI